MPKLYVLVQFKGVDNTFKCVYPHLSKPAYHILFPHRKTNMSPWIIQTCLALLLLLGLVKTTEGKKDDMLYCSGKALYLLANPSFPIGYSV